MLLVPGTESTPAECDRPGHHAGKPLTEPDKLAQDKYNLSVYIFAGQMRSYLGVLTRH